MTHANTKLALKAISLALLLVASAAWTVVQARSHRSHGVRSSAAAQASLAHAREQLEQQQVRVKQLQDSVADQESANKQASQRLQQQDKVIAQMRQELRALQAKQATGDR